MDITLVHADLTTCERKMAGENQQSTQHLSRPPESERLWKGPHRQCSVWAEEVSIDVHGFVVLWEKVGT